MDRAHEGLLSQRDDVTVATSLLLGYLHSVPSGQKFEFDTCPQNRRHITPWPNVEDDDDENEDESPTATEYRES